MAVGESNRDTTDRESCSNRDLAIRDTPKKSCIENFTKKCTKKSIIITGSLTVTTSVMTGVIYAAFYKYLCFVYTENTSSKYIHMDHRGKSG